MLRAFLLPACCAYTLLYGMLSLLITLNGDLTMASRICTVPYDYAHGMMCRTQTPMRQLKVHAK
jgi:hypothetical protein